MPDGGYRRIPFLKIVKYFAVIALGLAIVAIVAHLQRESILRKLTNSALSGQGFTATEVSVEALDVNQHVYFTRFRRRFVM